MEIQANKQTEASVPALKKDAMQGTLVVLLGIVGCVVARHFQYNKTGWGVLGLAATVGLSRFCYEGRKAHALQVALNSKENIDALIKNLPGKDRYALHYKLHKKDMTDKQLAKLGQYIQEHPYPEASRESSVQVLLHDNPELKDVQSIIQIVKSIKRPVSLSLYNTGIDTAGIAQICKAGDNIHSIYLSAEQGDVKQLIDQLTKLTIRLHISEWKGDCSTIIDQLRAKKSPLHVTFKNDQLEEVGKYPKPAPKAPVVRVIYNSEDATFLTQEDLDEQEALRRAQMARNGGHP